MSLRKTRKRVSSTRKFLYFFVFLSVMLLVGDVLWVQNKKQDVTSSHAQSSSSYPKLDRLETVATNVKGDGNTYQPNDWGYHKTRIITLATGDVYIPYITDDYTWHLMHRPPSGGWTEVDSGNAGTEPVNIVRGPGDRINIFATPNNKGVMDDTWSSDNGKTFSTTEVSNQFEQDGQGYIGAGANAKGNLAVVQTENDNPHEFWWGWYDPTSDKWLFNTETTSQGYSYTFVFPGDNNNLILSNVRDMHWSDLGYTPSGDFDYVFNVIENWHIDDVTNPQLQQFQVKEETPHSGSPNEMTYEEDANIDTKGVMHIIYEDANSNDLRESLVQNNTVIKDVSVPTQDIYKNRIIEDTAGKFYLITIKDNSLIVTPTTDSDTDGTQFGTPVTFDLGSMPGCDDWDFCLPPTLTVPRSGNPVSDTVDGVYGNMNKLYYFRLILRDSSSNPSPTVTPQPTISGTGTATATPNPTSSSGSTTVALTLCPHGVGNCGDNANPGQGGNASPKHTSRSVTLSFLNNNGQQVGTAQGTVAYASASQNFQGTISVTNLASGQYLVDITTPGFLPHATSGIATITSGQTLTLPKAYLVAGDVNNDGQLDILDYNLLISCYGSKQTSASCTMPPTATASQADLNDDGVVDGVDYNLFLREMSVQKGS